MNEPDALEHLISAPRFQTYVNATGGDRERAVALYHWTGQLGGAFLADYRHLEVAFRNTLDTALQDHVDNLDGWPANTAWFDRKWVQHHWWNDRAQQILQDARRQASRGRRQPPRGAIVAELSFAFWRYIISSRYTQSFWVPVLDATFTDVPGDTAQQRRTHLENQLIPLLKLRNRIAHHEPIFRPFVRTVRGGKSRRITVDQHHGVLIDVLRWIDADFAHWTQVNSAVPPLLLTRP